MRQGRHDKAGARQGQSRIDMARKHPAIAMREDDQAQPLAGDRRALRHLFHIGADKVRFGAAVGRRKNADLDLSPLGIGNIAVGIGDDGFSGAGERRA